MRRGLLNISAAITALAAITACAPVQRYNGYPIEPAATAPAAPQVGDFGFEFRNPFGQLLIGHRPPSLLRRDRLR